MVKREVYEEIGGFDEDYFMYAEDVALCYAIWQAGWEVHYVGKGSVLHHIGKSSSETSEADFSAVMQRESLELFFRKSRGRLYAYLFRLVTALSALSRFTCIPLLVIIKGWDAGPAAASRLGRKWWKLLNWSFGLRSTQPTKARDYSSCGLKRPIKHAGT